MDTWYSEPGVPSTRVKIDPATGLPYGESGKPSKPSGTGGGGGGSTYTVTFKDGSRTIKVDTLPTGETAGRT